MKRKISIFVLYTVLMTITYAAGQANTLIAENGRARVIEVDASGEIIWTKYSVYFPLDVERLDNGHTLIVEDYIGRIIEVNTDGAIVWQMTGLNGPHDAERLDNGNTLIVEKWGGRVIEIDNSGKIIWQKTGLSQPHDAERLDNGNTLIANTGAGTVVEVDSAGEVVWQTTVFWGIYDVERLANGNTLIVEMGRGRVIEVTSDLEIVWHFNGYSWDAERQANGNTLIALSYENRVIEVDGKGDIVWEKTDVRYPTDVERLASPAIEASINIDPNSLNLKSKGNWITAYIELPEGYDAADIDVSSVLLNDTVPAESKPASLGDYDADGIIDLMVKFNRDEVTDLLEAADEVEITITGDLIEGPRFEGKDIIKVINKGK